MRKIAISLNKGGVAKSSSACSIAFGLSALGKRVLLVDTDDQGQDSFLLGVKPTVGLAEVLNDEVSAKDAIFQARKNLWILSGGKSLAAAKRSIGKKEYGAEQTLAGALRPIENQFDYVILDTAPSFDSLTINVLFYAGEVLTPVSLEILSLNSLAEFVKSLEAIKRFNKELTHKYVLPTFYDGRVKKSAEILEQLTKYFPTQTCEPIRYSVKLSESAAFGKTISEFAPGCPAALDYKKVIKRIIQDEK